MNGLITALRTLSILPIPGKDAEDASQSLIWFPVAGLLLGLILFFVAIFPEFFTETGEVWVEGLAVLLLIGSIILTRAIHLDGLADWSDAAWGAHTKEDTLRIMKDSSIGTFGSAALICILLAKYACFVALLDTGGKNWIIIAYVVSRTAQVWMAASNDYAREDGTGSAFIKGASRSHALRAAVLCGIIVLVATQPLTFRSLILSAGAMVTAALFVSLFGMYCRKRIGGVTGDLLGTCNELTETIVLFIGASCG
jgi:adenosylcobinamide-GDP ribazoletransferase